jgi:hypothetical protein
MQQKSVNEFIKNMAAAGFDGSFRATNGEHTYRGTIGNGKVSTIKVQSVAESQRKIRELLGDK